MKDYTRNYLKFFDLGMDDIVSCEVCGKSGNINHGFDLHHIYARSVRKDLENDINNLILLCRYCHTRYGDKKKWYDFLTDKHKERMTNSQED